MLRGSLQLFLVSSAVGVALLLCLPVSRLFATSAKFSGYGESLNVSNVKSVDDHAVEVDGIRFEVLLSDVEVGERDEFIPEVTTFQIPEKPEFGEKFTIYSPENFTKVYIILRVTNQTDKTVFFPKFMQIEPMLFKQDRETIFDKRFCGEYHPFNPIEVGSILTFPNDAINLIFVGLLYWSSNDGLSMGFDSLYMGNIANPECFVNLTDGKLYLELTYMNQVDEINTFNFDPRIFSTDPSIRESVTTPSPSSPLRNVWKGTITVPKIELRLINP
jgi:hypothetical protein